MALYQQWVKLTTKMPTPMPPVGEVEKESSENPSQIKVALTENK
jgi:hypothetical protein